MPPEVQFTPLEIINSTSRHYTRHRDASLTPLKASPRRTIVKTNIHASRQSPRSPIPKLVSDVYYAHRDRFKHLLDTLDKRRVQRRSHLEHTKSHVLIRVLYDVYNILPKDFTFKSGDIKSHHQHPSGAGAFSDVYKASWLDTHVAVKVIRAPMSKSAGEIRKAFSTEVGIWKKLNHPYILRFLGTTEWRSCDMAMVSPWMPNGDAHSFILAHPEFNRLKLICNAASGLEYLHRQNPPITHGDLRGANILINEKEEGCLADFGLASISDDSAPSPIAHIVDGNSRYLAPEGIDPTVVGKSTLNPNPGMDMHSFGMLMLELMSARLPFHDIKRDGTVIIQVVIRNVRPRRPAGDECQPISDQLWSLIEACWSFPPSLRPTTPQVVRLLREEIRQAPRPPPLVVKGVHERDLDPYSSIPSSASLSPGSVLTTPSPLSSGSGPSFKRSDRRRVPSQLSRVHLPVRQPVKRNSMSKTSTSRVAHSGVTRRPATAKSLALESADKLKPPVRHTRSAPSSSTSPDYHRRKASTTSISPTSSSRREFREVRKRSEKRNVMTGEWSPEDDSRPNELVYDEISDADYNRIRQPRGPGKSPYSLARRLDGLRIEAGTASVSRDLLDDVDGDEHLEVDLPLRLMSIRFDHDSDHVESPIQDQPSSARSNARLQRFKETHYTHHGGRKEAPKQASIHRCNVCDKVFQDEDAYDMHILSQRGVCTQLSLEALLAAAEDTE